MIVVVWEFDSPSVSDLVGSNLNGELAQSFGPFKEFIDTEVLIRQGSSLLIPNSLWIVVEQQGLKPLSGKPRHELLSLDSGAPYCHRAFQKLH